MKCVDPNLRGLLCLQAALKGIRSESRMMLWREWSPWRALVTPSSSLTCTSYLHIWLLHNLVEANIDLFRYLLLGDQLKPWELHPPGNYMHSLRETLHSYANLRIQGLSSPVAGTKCEFGLLISVFMAAQYRPLSFAIMSGLGCGAIIGTPVLLLVKDSASSLAMVVAFNVTYFGLLLTNRILERASSHKQVSCSGPLHHNMVAT